MRKFIFLFFILLTFIGNILYAKNHIVITSSSSNTLYQGAVKKIDIHIVNYTNSTTITNTNISAIIGAKIYKDGDFSSETTIDIVKGTGEFLKVLYYTGTYSITFYDKRDVSIQEKFISTNITLNIAAPDSVYSGKVFINEIMYSVSVQDEQKWIEFYTTTNINLTNFYLLKGDSQKRYGYQLSDTDMSITNNRYIVMTLSKNYFNRYYPFVTEGTGEYKNCNIVEGKKEAPSTNILNFKMGDIVPSTPSSSSSFLSSTTLLLIDSSGKLVDFAVADDYYGGDKDISQERRDIYGDTLEKNNWGSSVSVYGCTPGKENSIAVNNNNIVSDFSSGNIYISKNPFNPDTETTKISFKINKNADIEINLYDINGRYLFNIEKKSSVSKDEVINYVFNGKKPDGSKLLPGMYIVYLKIIDRDTGEIVKHGKIIVIATELDK